MTSLAYTWRRTQAALGALAMGLLAVFAPVRGAEMPADVARVLAAGELRIAMTAEDWPPFFFRHPTRGLMGIDVELATEAARLLGVRVRFVREAQTFDEIVAMVVGRRADIAVSYLSDTLERAALVRFTRPYVELKQAVLLNRVLAGQARRGPGLVDLLNHPGARVGVTKGSSAESFVMADFPLADRVSFDTWPQITDALARAELLAGLSDQIDAQNWQTANPEGAIAIQTAIRQDQPDTIAIAVHRDDRQLHYWLNHFLARKQQDGTLARLHKHYLETDAWKKNPP